MSTPEKKTYKFNTGLFELQCKHFRRQSCLKHIQHHLHHLEQAPGKDQEDGTRDPKQHTLPRRTRGLTSTERRRVRSAERGGFASTTPVETKVRVQG